MNNVNLIGRLTRDPEIRRTQDGKAIANYTIAVDRFGEGADFIRCVSFGKTAEFAERWLKKGTKIALTGRIQSRTYEKDGGRREVVEVVVSNTEFVERKQEDPPEAPDDFITVPDDIDDEVPFV